MAYALQASIREDFLESISLKNLCLDLITHEFQRFHFAFKETKNTNLKEHFTFLQRKYTLDLMVKLSRSGKLKDEYLDILLNNHLQLLDGVWFKNSCNIRSMRDIVSHLPNLTKVSLVNICTDEVLEKIAEFCPKLNEIDISRSYVTDTGVEHFCKYTNGEIPCPELKKIFIRSCKVTDKGVRCLIQNLPSLEIIEHIGVPRVLLSIHKVDLPNLENARSYNLNRLQLTFGELSGFTDPYIDLLKICLTVCPKLKYLMCIITDEMQLNVFNNASLEELYIAVFKEDSKIDINNFLKTNGCNLLILNINNCIMSTRVLAASCPKLRDLAIKNFAFLDENDDSQSVFRCLTKCRFEHINDDSINEKATRFLLSSSPRLEWLEISHCNLSLEMKTHILKCCENVSLKCIVFFETPVEITFVRDILLKCKKLQILKILSLLLIERNFLCLLKSYLIK